MVFSLFRSPIFQTVFVVLSFLGLWTCTHPLAEKSPLLPKIEKGVLDLRHFDFDTEDSISLDGNWEFLPLHPNTASEWTEIQVPKPWNHLMPGEGTAVYRLKILLPGKNELLAIQFNDINTAFEARINNKLVAKKGKLGDTRESMVPSYKKPIVVLKERESELLLEIKISNHYHILGGIVQSIELGDFNYIINQSHWQNISRWILFWIAMSLGVFHLILFYFRRNLYTDLWFGLFSVLVSLRALFDDIVYFYELFPDSEWVWVHKLDILTFTGLLPLFSLFLHSVFPRDFPKTVLKFLIFIGVFFSFLTMITPSNFYLKAIEFFEYFLILIIPLFLYINFVTISSKRDGAYLYLFGSVILFITAANDILNLLAILTTGYISSYGFIGFLFSQTILLTKRYAYAFKELQFLKNNLEEKVIQRTEELNRAKITAESANNLKDKFIALVSHDLRSPTASVIGLLNILIDDFNELEEAEKMEMIKMALQSSEYSLEMISQLLSMERLRNGKIEVNETPESVHPLVESVTQRLYFQSKNKGILIHNQIPMETNIQTDKSLLSEVFFNLINNSIKFSHPYSEIYISQKPTKPDFVEFYIQDKGVGMSPEQLQKIFSSSKNQSSVGTGGEKGSGLGLPLVKDILHALQGDIQAHSEIGKGTTFTFSLPKKLNSQSH